MFESGCPEWIGARISVGYGHTGDGDNGPVVGYGGLGCAGAFDRDESLLKNEGLVSYDILSN